MADVNPSKVKPWVSAAFGADLRSLAALRIGTGLVLLYDLLQRSRDLVAHYSDFGLLTRTQAIAESHSRWLLSIHFMSGTWEIQALLFLGGGLFAVSLLIGYKTRLSTIVSWLLLCSLQSRNLFVNGGGDIMLRIVLFWGMFLPLGARFSVDSLSLSFRAENPQPFLSMGTIGYSVQFLLLYWFSVILKSGAEWWSEGSAIYYALSLDYLATTLARVVLEFPWIMKAGTYGTLAIEIIGPLLLVSPIYNPLMRMIGTCGIFALHLGILLTLRIGIFPVINMVSLLFFLPARFWDYLSVCFSSEFMVSLRFLHVVVGRLRWFEERLSECLAGHQGGGDSYRTNGFRRAAKFKLTWLENLAVAGLLVYLLVWNIATIRGSGVKLSERFRSLGYILRIDQQWQLFAPAPAKNDGWYVIPGKLKNGQVVDLFTGGKPVSWNKPPLISETYKNHHWRKYMEVIRGRASLVSYYAAYLCRDWNRRHEDREQLTELDIVFMLERTLPHYEYSPVEKRLFLHHSCVPEEKTTESSGEESKSP